MGLLFNANFLFYLAGYLIGAIPFGYLLGRFVGKVNIRETGSGSIGATNVLRVLKEKNPVLAKNLSILTVFCDALKGAIVMIVALLAGFDENVAWTIAVLAVIGHCFSPYLLFEGGKGIATGVGVVMVMLPAEACLGLLAWFIAAKAIKISSIASLVGMLTAVLLSFVIHPEVPGINTHAPIVIIGFIIFYKHIPNIVRLLRREEAKVV
ncbi:MAG: glycerol-3-phosphate 1-O-acyltransferase PlsY [Helicobacteraceae bacterium]|nr:glycerol-3-phosphate 1-O-acyltransferase PlsY [Helicobacteraceae bacterium]